MTPSVTARALRSPLSRLTAAGVGVGAALAFAGSAQAAQTNFTVYTSTWPAEYAWDGGGAQPSNVSTGSYEAYVNRDTFADSYADGYVAPERLCGVDPTDVPPSPVSCDTQQLRGGTEIKTYDPATQTDLPVSLAAGDVIRIANGQTKASLFDFTFAPLPAVVASVVGSPNFTIGRTAGIKTVTASLLRRVSRTVSREQFVPGTYQWVATSSPGSDDPLCSDNVYDYGQQKNVKITDTAPEKPTAELPAGQVYELQAQTTCSTKSTAVPGAPYETIADGRLTAVSEGSYSGTFGVPIAAGDLISYSEDTYTVSPEQTVYLSQRNIVAAGTVPPADTVAPKVTAFDFGAKSTTIKSFTKNGLLTFVTLDEAGTVTQTLQLPAPKPKSKKKKPKPPTVIGTGTGSTTAPGQTAKVLITSTKDGRKALKKIKKGKPAKLQLVTTIKDAAGNVLTSTADVKLAAK